MVDIKPTNLVLLSNLKHAKIKIIEDLNNNLSNSNSLIIFEVWNLVIYFV